jgi:hypothetical protein
MAPIWRVMTTIPHTVQAERPFEPRLVAACRAASVGFDENNSSYYANIVLLEENGQPINHDEQAEKVFLFHPQGTETDLEGLRDGYLQFLFDWQTRPLAFTSACVGKRYLFKVQFFHEARDPSDPRRYLPGRLLGSVQCPEVKVIGRNDPLPEDSLDVSDSK